MNRLRTELAVISRTGWIIAAVVWVSLTVLMVLVGRPNDPPPAIRAVMTILVPIPLAIFTLLVAYVNADARRRGMRHVMWTLLAVFIPNAIGIILYFLLREPLITACPACGQAVRGFAFCPHCGANLQKTCSQCHKVVEAGWSACAYCGLRL
jgi:hypothetical protein